MAKVQWNKMKWVFVAVCCGLECGHNHTSREFAKRCWMRRWGKPKHKDEMVIERVPVIGE